MHPGKFLPIITSNDNSKASHFLMHQLEVRYKKKSGKWEETTFRLHGHKLGIVPFNLSVGQQCIIAHGRRLLLGLSAKTNLLVKV